MEKLSDIEIDEYSIFKGELEYLLVKDTERNRQILLESGMLEDHIIENSCDGYIDIAEFVKLNWIWSQEEGLRIIGIDKKDKYIRIIWQLRTL